MKQFTAVANPGSEVEAGKEWVVTLLTAFTQMLQGVGALDSTWTEESGEGDRAMHVRRLLTTQELYRIGGKVRDIRGTPEETKRLKRMAKVHGINLTQARQWEHNPFIIPTPGKETT